MILGVRTQHWIHPMDNFGKQVTADGEVIIAGTRRPDGTYRKERKVRAGYVPPEEMGAFQTRGSMFRAAQAEAGIPGAPPGAPAGGEAEAVPMSKAAKKNAARKKKRQVYTSCVPQYSRTPARTSGHYSTAATTTRLSYHQGESSHCNSYIV